MRLGMYFWGVAADLGHMYAQNDFGTCKLRQFLGQCTDPELMGGDPATYKQALDMWRMAAAQGSKMARQSYNLEMDLDQGDHFDGVHLDEVRVADECNDECKEEPPTDCAPPPLLLPKKTKKKIKPNEKCPCGSGRKYKKCCKNKK